MLASKSFCERKPWNPHRPETSAISLAPSLSYLMLARFLFREPVRKARPARRAKAPKPRECEVSKPSEFAISTTDWRSWPAVSRRAILWYNALHHKFRPYSTLISFFYCKILVWWKRRPPGGNDGFGDQEPYVRARLEQNLQYDAGYEPLRQPDQEFIPDRLRKRRDQTRHSFDAVWRSAEKDDRTHNPSWRRKRVHCRRSQYSQVAVFETGKATLFTLKSLLLKHL